MEQGKRKESSKIDSVFWSVQNNLLKAQMKHVSVVVFCCFCLIEVFNSLLWKAVLKTVLPVKEHYTKQISIPFTNLAYHLLLSVTIHMF